MVGGNNQEVITNLLYHIRDLEDHVGFLQNICQTVMKDNTSLNSQMKENAAKSKAYVAENEILLSDKNNMLKQTGYYKEQLKTYEEDVSRNQEEVTRLRHQVIESIDCKEFLKETVQTILDDLRRDMTEVESTGYTNQALLQSMDCKVTKIAEEISGVYHTATCEETGYAERLIEILGRDWDVLAKNVKLSKEVLEEVSKEDDLLQKYKMILSYWRKNPRKKFLSPGMYIKAVEEFGENPLKVGPMLSWDIANLEKNNDFLLQNVDADYVLPYLQLNEEATTYIKRGRTSTNRTTRLLQVMKCRGRSAFLTLHRALDKAKFEFVTEELSKTLQSFDGC